MGNEISTFVMNEDVRALMMDLTCLEASAYTVIDEVDRIRRRLRNWLDEAQNGEKGA